jgi:hypothetical protein
VFSLKLLALVALLDPVSAAPVPAQADDPDAQLQSVAPDSDCSEEPAQEDPEAAQAGASAPARPTATPVRPRAASPARRTRAAAGPRPRDALPNCPGDPRCPRLPD